MTRSNPAGPAACGTAPDPTAPARRGQDGHRSGLEQRGERDGHRSGLDRRDGPDGRWSGLERAPVRWCVRTLAAVVICAGMVTGIVTLWWPASRAPAAVPGPVRLAGATPVAPGPNGELPDGWVNTQWGPLGPAGRALVEGVRRANLWEGIAGKMAAEKGASTRVREIGAMISTQHTRELDPETIRVGGQLRITLPTEPNTDQQTWLGEMDRASGPEFDRVFVARLRSAHAKVFQLIATVRANTRNSMVRQYAQTANRYVDGHIAMLDSTGLVQFNTLETPAVPKPAAAPRKERTDPLQPVSAQNGGPATVVIWLLLLTAGVGAVVTTFRLARPR